MLALARGPFVVVVLLLASFAAHADILALEPGKRIKGHQGLECDKCHESASGVSRTRCLGCHEHKPLERRIRANQGLHAQEQFQKSCESCHLEHKGPSFDPVDWSPVGGVKRFDHGLTGYKLEGAHTRQSCTACHESKYKESGRTKYLGLDPNCLSCHEDLHGFQRSHKELTDCLLCHSFDARAVTTNKGLKFDHGKTADFPLKGKHNETKCSNCHTSTTIFKMKDKPNKCVACHKDPHNNVYTTKGRDCKTCHSDEKFKFDEGDFAHGKHTEFTLRNKHAKQKCVKCHEPRALEPPRFACSTCHTDDSAHVVGGENRFAKRDCGQCHNDQGFKEGIDFNHAKNTSFALGGKHASLSCTNCHRAKPKAEAKRAVDTFEFFESEKCIGCHQHGKEHDGKFNDRPQLCTKCHVPGSTNIKTPKHSELSAVFDQQGAHAKVSCEKCHNEGLTKLQIGDDCSACHAKDDKHEGNLGTTCKQCHFEGYPWSDVLFDHNTQSQFKLDGRHQAVSCSRCHVNAPKAYKPLDVKCSSCHANQDVHEKALGTDCGKCHDTSGKASLFQHNTMTDYVLEGAHVKADCRGCHFNQDKATSSPAVFELDLKFPVVGDHCADCHGDPHGLRPGAQCLGCHDTESFKNAAGKLGAGDDDGAVPTPDAGPTEKAVFEGVEHTVATVGNVLRDQYHDIPPFSLDGGHSRLECHRCHGGRGDLTSVGVLCDTCHKQDDIHAGSLGPTCADCHSLRAFAPARFSHTTTGFSLVGVHRMLSCKQCHTAGNYMGITGDCVGCHLDDAARAQKTAGFLHQALYFTQPCTTCHNQVSWTRAPFFRRRF